MAQHAAPRTNHSRRRRFLVVAGIVLVPLLLAGVALAALLLRAPLTGGGTTGSRTLVWAGQVSVTQGPCTVVREGEAVRISFSGVFPGDSCQISGKVSYDLSRPATVQDPVFIDAPGVSLKFGSSSQLQAGDVISGQNMPAVQLSLTFGSELESGKTLTARADAGLVALDNAN